MQAIRALHLLVLSAIALALAGCAAQTNGNSALLIQGAQPQQSAVLMPKPNPLAKTVYAQTATLEEGEEEVEELVVNDKYEGLNRVFFGINRGFDAVLIRPVSKVYGALVPTPVKGMLRNFLRHLETPGDIINYTLQGNGKQVGRTLKRFVINSTLGLGGTFDAAGHIGTEYAPTDFGLTLAKWGVGEGQYVVSPLLGPSTTRDSFGRIVDIALRPQTYIGVITDFNFGGAIANGVMIIDQRQQNGNLLDDVIFASPDPYVTLRSTFLQRRRARASDNVLGAEGMEGPLPEIVSAGQ